MFRRFLPDLDSQPCPLLLSQPSPYKVNACERDQWRYAGWRCRNHRCPPDWIHQWISEHGKGDKGKGKGKDEGKGGCGGSSSSTDAGKGMGKNVGEDRCRSRSTPIAPWRRPEAMVLPPPPEQTVFSRANFNHVYKMLYIGNESTARNARQLGFTLVVTATHDLELARDVDSVRFVARLPFDWGALVTLHDAVNAHTDGKVLIHCLGGRHRAPTVTAVLLMWMYQFSLNDAVQRVNECRRETDMQPDQMNFLAEVEQRRAEL